MNIQKFLIGTVVGGVTLFLLGYLFYGVILADFFNRNTAAGAMKSMNDIVWWALILGNLASGALLTYIFLKIGSVNSFGSGVSTGAAIGFFMSLAFHLIGYATSTSMDRKSTAVGVLVGIVMNAIAGGIIAASLGMGKKKA